MARAEQDIDGAARAEPSARSFNRIRISKRLAEGRRNENYFISQGPKALEFACHKISMQNITNMLHKLIIDAHLLFLISTGFISTRRPRTALRRLRRHELGPGFAKLLSGFAKWSFTFFYLYTLQGM